MVPETETHRADLDLVRVVVLTRVASKLQVCQFHKLPKALVQQRASLELALRKVNLP